MRITILLACVVLGGIVGGAMIITHTGPGLRARSAVSSPGSRNTLRTQDLRQLADALTQYRKDHGRLPVQIASTDTQICSSFGDSCKQVHLVDLSFLTTGGDYLPTLPLEPLGGSGRWGAGYNIHALPNGSLYLSAPRAELDKTIELTFTP